MSAVVLATDGDAPLLQVEPTHVHAGGGVTIHGLDLPDAGEVVLELMATDGSAVALGSVVADHRGEFWAVVGIPAATSPGTFAVVATDDDGQRLTAPLRVDPAPPVRGEQRGPDEPLLVPVVAPSPTMGADATGATEADAAPVNDLHVAAGDDAALPVEALGTLLIVSVVGALLGLRVRRSPARR